MKVFIDPPPTPEIADLNMLISVGFGDAYVTKDGKRIYDENVCRDEGYLWTVWDAEREARKDPNRIYQIVMYGALHGEVYERKAENVWVRVEENRGFA